MAGLLRYPYDAITQTTDYLQLTVFQYQRNNSGPGGLIASASSGITNSNSVTDVSSLQSNKATVLVDDGNILLPMPSNISDSNSVSYDADSMNSIAATAVGLTEEMMTGVTFDKNFVTSITNTADSVMGQVGEFIGNNTTLKSYATKALAAQAVNIFGANVSLDSLLARGDGSILNPNMQLLFKSPTLRTFRFSFKLAPRNPREATEVKAIIRSLKRNMAPRTTGEQVSDGTGVFLQTPNMFKLRYRKGNKDHPFLHRFKDCALSDMSVQYTGDNVYATYADGTPVSMILNLTFKELLPIYADDYNINDDGEEFNDAQLNYGADVQSGQQKNVEGVGF